MRVFIDTNVLVALANEHDSLHAAAKKLQEKITNPITSDYVFDELTNIISRKKSKQHAIAFCNVLRESTPIEQVNTDEFEHAWNLFQRKNNFSFTDCTNLAIMHTFGISTIATFDQEFEKIEGITVLK